jgi:hypothetical protein
MIHLAKKYVSIIFILLVNYFTVIDISKHVRVSLDTFEKKNLNKINGQTFARKTRGDKYYFLLIVYLIDVVKKKKLDR